MSEVVTITSKKKKAPFIIGLIVLIFAITGVVSIVNFAVSKLSTGEEETVDYSEYADFLTWVVGVDPAPFSDITNADKVQDFSLKNNFLYGKVMTKHF